MSFPDDLKYTKQHEWVRVEGNIATIGITDFAQNQLGDIVFVELPEKGEAVKKGEPFGVVESVKAVSDVYSAVTGKVLEINDSLNESPETVNEDCYGEGWIIKVEMNNPKELDALMDNEKYTSFTNEEAA